MAYMLMRRTRREFRYCPSNTLNLGRQNSKTVYLLSMAEGGPAAFNRIMQPFLNESVGSLRPVENIRDPHPTLFFNRVSDRLKDSLHPNSFTEIGRWRLSVGYAVEEVVNRVHK